MADLKPCPICGGKEIGYLIKADTRNYERIYYATMFCRTCRCCGERVFISTGEHNRISVERNGSCKKKAIEAWNRTAENCEHLCEEMKKRMEMHLDEVFLRIREKLEKRGEAEDGK